MAYIDDETINKIKEENDIVDVIGSYINLTTKGKNFFCVCPFHSDHQPSMSVSREKQLYKCFSCGASGNVISFVMNYENISFIEALDILGKKVGISFNYSKKEDNKYKDYYKIYDTVLSLYKNNLESKDGKKAKDYLNKRGLTNNTIKEFDIGLSLDNMLVKALSKCDPYLLSSLDLIKDNNKTYYDTFTKRIMFPIHNISGDLVAFSGRIYNDEDTSKYVNTSETVIFKKGLILYNYHRAKEFIKKEKCVIICEGFMDVIRLSTIGYKNAVALMGTSCTKEQYELIKKLNANVVLNLDQDNAGKNATIVIGDMFIKDNVFPKVIVFDKYKDSDEAIFKEGNEYFDKAFNNKVDIVDFKFNYLKKDYNLKNDNELATYLNNMIDIINNIDDPVLQDIKIKQLISTYNISESVIYSKINKNSKKAVIEKKEIPKKKIYNKYDKSELKILYLMLNDEDVIRIFENNLGYLINEKRDLFAQEIVKFKNKHKSFITSDFITYISQNEELLDVFNEINAYNNDENYTLNELDDYIETIRKNLVNTQIKKIENKIKETLDINEKIRLLEKIEKMKKDVLKW